MESFLREIYKEVDVLLSPPLLSELNSLVFGYLGFHFLTCSPEELDSLLFMTSSDAQFFDERIRQYLDEGEVKVRNTLPVRCNQVHIMWTDFQSELTHRNYKWHTGREDETLSSIGEIVFPQYDEFASTSVWFTSVAHEQQWSANAEGSHSMRFYSSFESLLRSADSSDLTGAQFQSVLLNQREHIH
jgi:hypothetical protein